MTTTMTIAEFIAKYNVSMFVEAVDANPYLTDDSDWNLTASHWRCLLRHGNRRMTVYFSQGSAYTGPPTCDDVLDAVASDSRSAGQTFLDWCAEYGYSDDSIKALKAYRVCERQSGKLRSLLGDDAYAELLDCESL